MKKKKKREITKALVESGEELDINYICFSLECENFEYVWYCSEMPQIDLYFWFQKPETQSILIKSIKLKIKIFIIIFSNIFFFKIVKGFMEKILNFYYFF